jgi:diaminopimelate decarboxylase
VIDASATVCVTGDELREALERFATSLEHPSVGRRAFFPDILHRVLGRVAAYQSRQPLLRFCYSVKTNPGAAVLREVKGAALLAEVISPDEFEHAIECGFSPDEIVYNGPHPAQYCARPPGYVFADSIEAYLSAARGSGQTIVGIRLRPPHVESHFGLPAARLHEFVRAVRGCGRGDIGVSFHVRPEDYGAHTFRTLTEAVVASACEIERSSGARVVVVDVGGGKQPVEFDDAIREGDLEWLQQYVADRLPQVASIFIEPGQALVTACEAVVAPILEVRLCGTEVAEIVVDAGYPELSQIGSFAHRFFLLSDAGVQPLGDGTGRIIGRTCLEYDILSAHAELRGCRVGDAIAVADAGAYDASMSFAFGQGERRT